MCANFDLRRHVRDFFQVVQVYLQEVCSRLFLRLLCYMACLIFPCCYCAYNVAHFFPKCNQNIIKNFLFWLTSVPKYVIINYAPDGRNSGYPQSYPQGKNNQKKFTLGVDFLDKRSYTIRTIRDTGQVQKAGNVKQEGQIPEFNTLPMPEGSGSKKIQQKSRGYTAEL